MCSIKIKNLYKRFPSEISLLHKRHKNKEVLKDINFQVEKGEIFCIVGSNGAGKTTLIKILCGLIIPTSGKVYINRYDIIKYEYKIKSYIGLVTGYERSFYWRLTARQNLEFFAKLYNLSKKDIESKIDYLKDLLDLKEELDKRFHNCSAGFKQRIAIARALLQDPKVLFMDEPTRSLDPIAAKKLRNFVKSLSKKSNKTIFFATHDLNEAELLADRIALINKGEILSCGSADELKDSANKDTLEEVFEYYISSCRSHVSGSR